MNDRIVILQTLKKMRKAYKAGAKKLDYLPLRLWVELTSVCNLQCSFCPNSMPRRMDRGFMTFDTFKEIVDQSKAFAYDMNLSHRGESLLHERLPQMVAYAKQNDISTRLNTNATLLDEVRSRDLIQSGLDYISFSFDGLDPVNYEAVRSNATYDHTLGNILKFLEIKKQSNSITPYVMLEVLDMASVDASRGVIREFKAKFRGLPLNKLTIKPLHNWGGQMKNSEVFPSADYPTSRPPKYSPCTNIWYSMVILWDGSVALCCQDWYDENCLGNIADSCLEAMWNGETIVTVRDLLARKEFRQVEVCGGCDLLWRPAVRGVPKINLVSFLSENLAGYGKLRRFFSPVEKFLEGKKTLSARKIIK